VSDAKDLMVARVSTAIPATATVPAAAAKQQNENYNDENRGHIHVGLLWRRPSFRTRSNQN
jgi:hypothetical protein